jgi:hypothetical protein
MDRFEQAEVESVAPVSSTSSSTTDAHVALGLMEVPECTRTHLSNVGLRKTKVVNPAVHETTYPPLYVPLSTSSTGWDFS